MTEGFIANVKAENIRIIRYVNGLGGGCLLIHDTWACGSVPETESSFRCSAHGELGKPLQVGSEKQAFSGLKRMRPKRFPVSVAPPSAEGWAASDMGV